MKIIIPKGTRIVLDGKNVVTRRDLEYELPEPLVGPQTTKKPIPEKDPLTKALDDVFEAVDDLFDTPFFKRR